MGSLKLKKNVKMNKIYSLGDYIFVYKFKICLNIELLYNIKLIFS